MKKGVTLRVQVYIEGDDEPAHDFSQTGKAVVADVLQRGFKAYSGPYSIKVQKMDPVEGGDDDAESDEDPTEITPLFAYTPSATAAAQAAPAAGVATQSVAPPPAAPSAGPAGPSAAPSGQPAVPKPAPAAQPQQARPPDEHKHHFWDR